jgi:hypothetical protein
LTVLKKRDSEDGADARPSALAPRGAGCANHWALWEETKDHAAGGNRSALLLRLPIVQGPYAGSFASMLAVGHLGGGLGAAYGSFLSPP